MRASVSMRPTRRPGRPDRRHLAAVVAGLALAACGATPAAGDPQDPPPGASVVASMPVPTPRDVQAGYGSIWVSDGPSRSVTRIDPATGAVQAVVPVPDPASVLAMGAGAVWLTSVAGDSVTRIDPATDRVTGSIPLAPHGLAPVGIVVARGHVWVAVHDGEPVTSVAKLDPATMAVIDVIPVGDESFAGPNLLAVGAGSLWTDVPSLDAVVRIDPATDEVLDTIPVRGACGGIAASDTAVWVAGGSGPGCQPGISRIDPATDAVSGRITAGGQVNPLALDGGTLWFGSWNSDFLGRVDTGGSAVVGQLKLPGPAFGLTAAFGAVWITLRDAGLLLEVRPD